MTSLGRESRRSLRRETYRTTTTTRTPRDSPEEKKQTEEASSDGAGRRGRTPPSASPRAGKDTTSTYTPYRGRHEDPERFALYERERELEELLERRRPSPFLRPSRSLVHNSPHRSPIRQHPSDMPPALLRASAMSSHVVTPSRPAALSRDELVSMDEHRQVVEDLIAQHNEEIRRSDIIHARHCNDLVSTIEEARAQRDAQVRENKRLLSIVDKMKLETETYRGNRGLFENVKRDKDVLSRRVDDLTTELESLKTENQTLRYEASKVYDLSKKQEAETKKAFSELKAEYDQVVAANQELSLRLSEGTADYRNLDQSYIDLEHQATLGKHRYMQLSEELQRRNQARAQVKRQVDEVDALVREMHSRLQQRATGGSTPVKPLLADISEVNQAVGVLLQLVHANKI